MNPRRAASAVHASHAQAGAILPPRPLLCSTACANIRLGPNDDTGNVVVAWRASPPTSGKPEGGTAFPLEPLVQGRFARIGMVEDAPIPRPASRTSCAVRAVLVSTERKTAAILVSSSATRRGAFKRRGLCSTCTCQSGSLLETRVATSPFPSGLRTRGAREFSRSRASAASRSSSFERKAGIASAAFNLFTLRRTGRRIERCFKPLLPEQRVGIPHYALNPSSFENGLAYRATRQTPFPRRLVGIPRDTSRPSSFGKRVGVRVRFSAIDKAP